MAYTIENNYTGNGTTRLYSFTFPYLEDTDVKVSLNGVATTNFTLANATQINFTADAGGATSTQEASGAPKSSVAIRIYRDTNIDNLQAEFFSGSAIRSQDLNNDFNQTLYVSQETEKSVEGKWNDSTQTLDSTEAFVDSNDYIMTAAAIDDRIIAKQAARALADGKIIVGNGSGVGAEVTPSGDVTMANTGAFTIATGAVEHDMLAGDAVDGDNIGDDVVNSEHIAAGAIDLEHMSSASVDSDNIVNDTIVNADINSSAAIAHSKLANITNGQILVGSGSNVPTAVAVSGDVTLANTGAVTIANAAVEHVMMADDAVDGDIIAADAVTGAHIADDSIDSEHYVAASIDNEHLADDAVGADELAANAVVNASIDASAAIAHSKLASVTDGQILVGNGSNVPTAVAVSGDVTIANTGAVTIANDAVEIGMIGCEQTTISDSDSHIPTSGAVVDYVSSVIAPIGGLEVIADDESFPNTIPAAGVVISITDAAGLQVNSSGVSTNGDALDNSTITINGFPSELRGGVGSNADPYVFGSGAGLMVVSTGSSQTYNYHQAMIREADFVQLSDDINDFNNRYRIGTRTANSASSNDDGDLFFDTGTNKMYVYDGAYDAGGEWKEVTSAGDYKFLTIKDHDQAVGGSGPTYGSPANNVEFDLFDGSADASISSAAQLIVVLNGVIQKPNAAYDGSMEGFSLNDTHGIKFATAPPANSSMFVTQIGTATTISTPGTGSISNANMFAAGVINAAAIGTSAVETAKIADDAVNTGKIEDGSITYAKIQNISATNRVLGRDSSGPGVAEEIAPAALRTMLNVEDGADVTDATNVNAAGAIMHSDLGTKGQIVVGDGSGDATILAVGSNDHVLTADSSEASGVKWAAASSGVTSDANSNTLAGTNAGTNITSGQGIQNSLYGYNAGNDITTGDHNACFGMGCGEEIDTGSDNVAIGYYALAKVTSEGNNIAIGYKALNDATADNNIAIGMGAMMDHTTGEKNIAIGVNALKVSTSGGSNICIGWEAGIALDDGATNIAIGDNALDSTTSGGQNVAIGHNALHTQDTESYNTAVGYDAGKTANGSTHSVWIGRAAGGLGTSTGNENTWVGYASGIDNTSGEYNTGCGSGAGGETTTGSNNTYVGMGAGYNNTESTGQVIIGYNAQPSAATGESYETVIGAGGTGKGDRTFFFPHGNGAYQGNNSASWSTTSDRRIKKNIVDNNVGLSIVDNIKVRNFEYKQFNKTAATFYTADDAETQGDNPTKRIGQRKALAQYVPKASEDTIDWNDFKANVDYGSIVVEKSGVQLGIIAQELETVAPNCVTTTSNGVKTVDTDELFWHMLNAIKELSAKVKALEAK